MPNKKPRVFFSEEQKDTLRLAYTQDPYPNPNTIECLAQQLGVSSKTIVNWFHNHRMRAKQQHPLNGYRGDSSDEMSNHSDSLSSSGHSDILRPGLNQSQGSESQWLFPTPEMVSESRRSSINSDGSERCYDAELRNRHISGENLLIGAPKMMLAAGGNRRKSAKPKWAFEGTQLDKSRQTIDFESGELQPCDLSMKKRKLEDDTGKPEEAAAAEGQMNGQAAAPESAREEAGPVDFSDKSKHIEEPKDGPATESNEGDSKERKGECSEYIDKIKEINVENNNKSWDL